MASITQQRFLIQRETTPGVEASGSMRAYMGLKLLPGFAVEGESFRGSGYRASTARTVTADSGAHSVEAPQDFNALLPVVASVFGLPQTTQPDDVNAPEAYQHVATLMGRGARNPVTFTGLWGDASFAMKMVYLAFNAMSFGVQRSALTFDTSAVSRTPETGASLPSEPSITEVPAVPIPSSAYDVFIDDAWDDLGTTKLLACYDASVEIGETWGQDTPINSAIVSFAELVENEEIDFAGSMQVGLHAEAAGLFDSFTTGAIKYVRIAADGPVIADEVRYRVQIDYPIRITSPGETQTAPNSPTVVMPFEYELTPDPDTGKLAEITIVNTVPSV